jgi:tetratricopeptide (TPR) repeat protein
MKIVLVNLPTDEAHVNAGSPLTGRARGKEKPAADRRRNIQLPWLAALLTLVWLAACDPSAVASAQPASSYDRLERAAGMISQGQLAAAEAELSSVLRRDARDANALNLLGVIRAQQQRPGEAEQLFLRAAGANPALLGAYLNLGRLYLELQKTDRALWAFTEASKLAPDNEGVNFNLASLYEEKRDYERSLEYLGKIQSPPEDVDYLYLLIKSHLGLGHVAQARALSGALKQPGRVPADAAASFAALFAEHKLFDEAVEILRAAQEGGKPSFALLYNLGAGYYQKGERARAEESYLAALALKPDDVETLRALATIAQEAGDLEKALSFLTRARKVAPDSPAVLYDFGWAALNLNLIYDALQALGRLHRMQPDKPDYLYALAIARLQNGEAAQAQQLLNRFVELRPADARGYYVLGATLYSVKQYAQARAALERSLQLAPYADAEYYLGMIAYNEGDMARATTRLQSALKAKPNYPAAHTALGLVYVKQKNFAAARTELERAIALDPKDGTAHYQLGLVLARLGEKALAQAMFAAADKLRGEKEKEGAVRFRLIDPPK